MRISALFILLALASTWSNAGVTIARFPPNPGVMPGGGWKWSSNSNFAEPVGARAWVNGTYGGLPAVISTSAMEVAGPVAAMAVQVARSATLPAVGAAVARCLGNPVCMAAAAGAAVWAESMRVKPEGGGLVHDQGVVEETVTGWTATGVSPGGGAAMTGSGTSQTEAAENLVVKFNRTTGGNTACLNHYSYRASAPLSASVHKFDQRLSYTQNPTGNYGTCGSAGVIGEWQHYGSVTTAQAQVTQCPASIDALNPANNIPAGRPKDPDGRCKTGRYNHAIPVEGLGSVAEKFNQYPPADPADVARGAVEGGQEIAAEPSGVTGPASQQAPAEITTVQNPNGTTTVTSVVNNWNMSYSFDSVAYSPWSVTTVNNNGEITTTTTNPQPPPVSPELEPENPCKWNPESIGCSKFGEVADEPLQERDISVVAAPQAGWGSTGGSCPAPQVVEISGMSLPIDNTILCQFLEGIRFAVIGAFAMAAALVFVGGIKS